MTSHIAPPPPTKTAKRGRPKKTASAPAMEGLAKKNLHWTVEMERALLNLRYVKHVGLFSGTKGKIQLAAAWRRMVLDLNLTFPVEVVTVEQAKNKIHQLMSTYRNTRIAMATAKNSTEVVYPANWDLLMQCFQNHKGLSVTCLGESGGLKDRDEHDLIYPRDSVSTVSSVSDGTKRRKVDLAEALTNMGFCLKEGLTMLGGQTTASNGNDALATALKNQTEELKKHRDVMNEQFQQLNEELKKHRDEMKKQFQQSAAIQLELLNFLKNSQSEPQHKN